MVKLVKIILLLFISGSVIAAPSISGVSAYDITKTAAKITWTVSQKATGQVEYGTTLKYGRLSTKETSFNYSTHIQQLKGLTAGTIYHYRVKSSIKKGVQVVSRDFVFNTLGITVTPTTPPVIVPPVVIPPIVTPPVVTNPPSTGVLVCAKQPTNSLVVNVLDTGALGNGKAKDTSYIQNAINKVGGTGGTVFVPNGTYMIDAPTSLNLKSNMTLSLEANAILKAIPNSAGSYAIVLADQVSNVNIYGGTIQGERSQHSGSGGEWGMGLEIDSSNNVIVERITSRDAWGDGFYLSGETQSKNITLCTVTADNNRRQGISIESNDGLIIKDSVFKNTNGTAPADGLDIEPYSGRIVQNVQILNNTFSGNKGHGLEIIAMDGKIDNVKVTGNTFSGNTGSPTYVHPAATNITISGSH